MGPAQRYFYACAQAQLKWHEDLPELPNILEVEFIDNLYISSPLRFFFSISIFIKTLKLTYSSIFRCFQTGVSKLFKVSFEFQNFHLLLKKNAIQSVPQFLRSQQLSVLLLVIIKTSSGTVSTCSLFMQTKARSHCRSSSLRQGTRANYTKHTTAAASVCHKSKEIQSSRIFQVDWLRFDIKMLPCPRLPTRLAIIERLIKAIKSTGKHMVIDDQYQPSKMWALKVLSTLSPEDEIFLKSNLPPPNHAPPNNLFKSISFPQSILSGSPSLYKEPMGGVPQPEKDRRSALDMHIHQIENQPYAKKVVGIVHSKTREANKNVDKKENEAPTQVDTNIDEKGRDV